MKTQQISYPKLSNALGLKTEVWLKREDLHPLGSHKGRSIPLMIEEHLKQGVKSFVISSSGNAALAALLYVKRFNINNSKNLIKLTILVGQKIDNTKLKKLLDENTDQNIVIKQVVKPKQEALQTAKSEGVVFLRQSTDKYATLGYHDLAGELSKIESLAAVFVPTSSGTTAIGLAEGFKKLNKKIKIYIVQTNSCHPMVSDPHPACNALHSNAGRPTLSRGERATISSPQRRGTEGEVSLATAIVDKIAHRKNEILKILAETGGQGLVVDNAGILEAQQLVKNNCEFNISPNSALSVAGLEQAIKNGQEFSGPVACLITGD